MSLDVLSGLIPALAFVFVALEKWKRGLTNAWKEEAEAQKLRADRLAQQVEELTKEVRALRAENAELRALLTSVGQTGTFRVGGENAESV